MKRENGKHIACSARPAARPLRAQLFTSILAVVLCCALLCASTFAWFTANATATVSTIQAAQFSSTASTSNGTQLASYNIETYSDEGGTLTAYTYTYDQSGSVSFILSVEGTGSGEFFLVLGTQQTMVGDTLVEEDAIYKTVRIAPGENITLTILNAEGATLTFIPIWGDPATYDGGIMLAMNGETTQGEEEHLYGDGETIVFAEVEEDDTPFVWYALVAGITVEDLAAYYGVSVDYVLKYNHLASLDDVGNDIKIPNPNGLTLPYIPDKDDEDDPSDEPDEDKTDEDGEKVTDETDTPEPTDTPAPTDTPEPTDTSAPEGTPEPSNSPEPTDTPAPEDTPEPTETPEPSDTPEPTETPEAAEAPTAEDTPAPVSDSEVEPEAEPEVDVQALIPDTTPAADPEPPAADADTPTETE